MALLEAIKSKDPVKTAVFWQWLNSQERRQFALRSFLLLVVVFVVYSPALRGTYLWDDHGHVPDQPTFYTFSGLSKIWSQPGFTQQYYPLTFTTVWLAHHIWGNNPVGYHLLTVLFHGLNGHLVISPVTRVGLSRALVGGTLVRAASG